MQYCAKSCNIGGCNPQVTCGSGGQTTTTTNTTIAPTTQSALGTCTITYSNTDISPGSHDISTKLGQITDCCGFCNSTAGCLAYVWDNGQGGECWLKSATGPLVSNTAKTSGILNQ
uniref:Apple domain-containing protein n=1 Tax=Acrobeloides nanus TaxID=290746 RepID=A0A914CUJ3_9BILA